MSESTTQPLIENRLMHFPVSLFATVMGLAGLTIATMKMEHHFGLSNDVSAGLLLFSILVYACVLLIYLFKWVRFPQAVAHEFSHPIRLSFFPASSIGAMLIAIALLPHNKDISMWFWGIGSAAHLAFTLVILSRWMHHDQFQIQHSNPAWFIPMVGNILAPVAGVELGYMEVSWFFFSIGLIMWLPLLAVLLNRFFFHPMLPSKLVPTLFIMIAPPTVGFISWMKLHGGQIDDVARVLYYFGLFMTFLMAAQYKHFMKIGFALPWWAYSFPVAAISIATMIMQEAVGGLFFDIAAIAIYVFLVILLTLLVYKTARAILAKKICVPE